MATFDPDAYLAKQTPAGFDPDAYLKARAPAPAGAPVGGGQAFGAGVAQGATANFGDEIEGAIQSLLRKYVEKAPWDEGKSLGDLYAEDRDYRRKENERARTERPGAYIGGNVAGGLITAPLVPGGPATSTGAKLLQAAKVGAGYGAVSGAGRAESMEDVPASAALDASIGALVGPAATLAGNGVARGGRFLKDWLAQKAFEQGQKALTGNAGTIAVKKPLSEAAVEAAYSSGAIRPGSAVSGIAERLGEAREAAGAQYAQILDDLAAKGVTGPRANKLALELSDEARQMVQTGNPVPDLFRKIAGEVAAEPGAATMGGALPLSTAETIKRNLQNAARAEYVKEGPTSLAGAGKKELAARVREAVEDAVAQQASKAPTEAAAFVPAKQKLGALIEASNAADIAAARAARHSGFGLPEATMAAGGMAAGSPTTAAGAFLLTKMLKQRAPSTLGWAARQIGRAIPASAEAPVALVPGESAGANEWLRALAEALNARVGLAGATAEDRK